MPLFLSAVSCAAFFAAGLLLGNLWDRLGREIDDMTAGWAEHHCTPHDSPMTLIPRHFLPMSWQDALRALAAQPEETMVTHCEARMWRVLDELKLVKMGPKNPSKEFSVALTGFGHVLVKWL